MYDCNHRRRRVTITTLRDYLPGDCAPRARPGSLPGLRKTRLALFRVDPIRVLSFTIVAVENKQTFIFLTTLFRRWTVQSVINSEKRPDVLDCLLLWSFYQWSRYRDRELTSVEIFTVISQITPFFSLPENPFNITNESDWFALEWVAVVAESLWGELVSSNGSDWSVEALEHLSQIIVERMPNIKENSYWWCSGVYVNDSQSLNSILRNNFPNLGSFI